MLKILGRQWNDMKPDYDSESSFYFGRDLAVPFYLSDVTINDDWTWDDVPQPQTSFQMFSNSVTSAIHEEDKASFYRSRKAQIGVKGLGADVFFGSESEDPVMNNFQTLVASLTSISIVPNTASKFGNLTLYRCADQSLTFWRKMEFLALAMSPSQASPHPDVDKIVLPFSMEELGVLEDAPFDLVIAHHPSSFRAIPMIIVSDNPMKARELFRYYVNHFKRVMFDLLAHFFVDDRSHFDACVDKLFEEFGIRDHPQVEEGPQTFVSESATKRRRLRMARAPSPRDKLAILSRNFGFRFADALLVGDELSPWFMYPDNTYYSDTIGRRVHRNWEFTVLAMSQAPFGKDLAVSTIQRIAEKVGFASISYPNALLTSIREISAQRSITRSTLRDLAGQALQIRDLWQALLGYAAILSGKTGPVGTMLFLEAFIRNASNYVIERGGYEPLMFTRGDMALRVLANAAPVGKVALSALNTAAPALAIAKNAIATPTQLVFRKLLLKPVKVNIPKRIEELTKLIALKSGKLLEEGLSEEVKLALETQIRKLNDKVNELTLYEGDLYEYDWSYLKIGGIGTILATLSGLVAVGNYAAAFLTESKLLPKDHYIVSFLLYANSFLVAVEDRAKAQSDAASNQASDKRKLESATTIANLLIGMAGGAREGLNDSYEKAFPKEEIPVENVGRAILKLGTRYEQSVYKDYVFAPDQSILPQLSYTEAAAGTLAELGNMGYDKLESIYSGAEKVSNLCYSRNRSENVALPNFIAGSIVFVCDVAAKAGTGSQKIGGVIYSEASNHVEVATLGTLGTIWVWARKPAELVVRTIPAVRRRARW